MSTKTRRPTRGHQKGHRPHQNQSSHAAAATTAPKEAKTGTRSRKQPTPRRRARRFDPTFGQLAVVGAIVAVGALFWLATRGSGGEARSGDAPVFTLASTSGGQVSLSDYRGHNVLLYFNEGVGCDACFYQTVELEQHASDLQAKDITLLPIVVNPADQVSPYLQQFGITTPYLIDADGSVSRAYQMMGKGMHANLPGHGFVFIDASGQERWSKEYPSMYASTSEVLSAVGPYLD